MLKELGDCHAAVADYERARQCYRSAASMAPDEAGPYVGLGVIAIQTEDLEEARASFEIARKLDPNCSEAYAGLAMVHQQRRDYQKSFDMYLASLQLNPDNLVALLGLFQTSCQMGTFAKIIHYLEIYLDRHPTDTSVLFCLASLYAREGMLNQARDILLTVLELEPDKTEANQLLREVRSGLRAPATQGTAHV